ncbi:ABC transporter substrate-binding protein [Aestuariivirga litoralis]|uniref:ABC transporter substrate-binding protein n=1 Tax=Aestuariivirga litoralis TaxID=2650924 RepID=UPI001FEFAF28|nr:ABC transporter substrate-binding protein [Aestuariivirga litoralis]MBG1231764.1 ABC transporter substrate-binding protein [Aestuariivirga litoralis]
MIKHLKLALLAGAIVSATLPQLAHQAFAETPKDTLVVAKQIDDLISLDPAEAYELSGIEVLANTYDRIMRFEPTDITKLVGGVAETASVSDDGKTFTFKIRPGQKFASGNPVTAQDAVFSLTRVIKLEKTPVFLLSQLGWTKDNVDKLVTAPDDSTLKITITEDFAPSLVYALLSSVVGSVVDSKVAKEHEKDGDFGYAWLKTNSAGSGAYVVKSWKANESVSLEANPNYRGGEAKLKRVVIRHVAEPAAQRLLVEKGDADIARNLTPDQIAGLAGNKDVVVTDVPQALLYYIGLNLKTKELQDPKVRQAIRYLVDYKGMADTFLKGSMQVHQSFWASGFWASYDENPYSLNVEKAKALLKEAGYPDGFSLKLDIPNSAPFTNIAQSVQSTLAQGGIKVELLPADTKAVLTKYRARQHQALMIYWGPDYMDPHTNADGFVHNTNNADDAKAKPLAWRNAWPAEEETKLTDAAVKERDEAKRKDDYIELQKKVLDTGPYVIMFQNTEEVASRANVKGYVEGPSADVVYYNLTTK